MKFEITRKDIVPVIIILVIVIPILTLEIVILTLWNDMESDARSDEIFVKRVNNNTDAINDIHAKIWKRLTIIEKELGK